MTLTPPLSPLSKLPLPRPPARTWALMTISSPSAKHQPCPTKHSSQLYRGIPMLLATASASCGERATSPFGTPMPYCKAVSPNPLHKAQQHLHSSAASPKGTHGSKARASAVPTSFSMGSCPVYSLLATALLGITQKHSTYHCRPRSSGQWPTTSNLEHNAGNDGAIAW